MSHTKSTPINEKVGKIQGETNQWSTKNSNQNNDRNKEFGTTGFSTLTK